MKRRLMKSVARMTRTAGVSCARSCAEATIEAPAKTITDIAMAAAGEMPLATIATPVMMPKGAMPSSTGRAARAPSARAGRWRRLLFTETLPHAGAGFVALLVLARFARLPEGFAALLGFSLAFGRILRLRAHLVSHARAMLRPVLLTFAGAFRLRIGGLHLVAPLGAGLGILGLRAVEMTAFLGRLRAVGRSGRGLGE